MTDKTQRDCLKTLEGKYRSKGAFWNDALGATLLDLIEGWDDYDGQRAVHRFTYEEGDADVGRLSAIYRDFRNRRTSSQVPQGEKLPGAVILRALRAGYTSAYRDIHGGADPREDDPNMVRFRKWQARLDAGLTIDGRTLAEVEGGPVPGRPNVVIDRPPERGGGLTQPLTEKDPFEDE